MQYSTVQYSTVHYSTVQCSTVHYSTVQHSTVQYNAAQHSTAQHTRISSSISTSATSFYSVYSSPHFHFSLSPRSYPLPSPRLQGPTQRQRSRSRKCGIYESRVREHTGQHSKVQARDSLPLSAVYPVYSVLYIVYMCVYVCQCVCVCACVWCAYI
jgi:hypothetical protein